MESIILYQREAFSKHIQYLDLLFKDERKVHKIPDALRGLGIFLQQLFPDECQFTRDFRVFFEKFCVKQTYCLNSEIENTALYQVFLAVWKDDVIGSYPSAYLRQTCKAKGAITKPVRHQIHLGLLALQVLIACDRAVSYKLVTYSTFTPIKIAEYDAKISEVLRAYLTAWQICLLWVGKSLAFVMAAICGLMIFVAVVTLCPATWPLAVSLVLASMMGMTTHWVNWPLFSEATPYFLLDLIGKTYLGQGFVEVIDEYGKCIRLSVRKQLLLVGALLLSCSAGVGSAILTYSTFMSLSKIPTLAFLAITGIAAPLSAISVCCLTALLFKAFSDILKTTHIKDALKKPFEIVEQCFNPNIPGNQGISIIYLRYGKYFSYTLIAVLTLVTLGGLLATCYVSQQFLAQVLCQIPTLSTPVIQGVSYIICMGLFFLAKLPFTVLSTTRAVSEKTATITKSTMQVLQGITLKTKRLLDKLTHTGVWSPTQLISTIEQPSVVLVEIKKSSLSCNAEFMLYPQFISRHMTLFGYTPPLINAVGNGLLITQPIVACVGRAIGFAASVGAAMASFFGVIGCEDKSAEQMVIQNAAHSRQRSIFETAVY